MLIFHVGNRKLLPLKQLYTLKEIFDKFRLMNHNIAIVLLMLHLSWLKSHSEVLKVLFFLIFNQASCKSNLLKFEDIF